MSHQPPACVHKSMTRCPPAVCHGCRHHRHSPIMQCSRSDPEAVVPMRRPSAVSLLLVPQPCIPARIFCTKRVSAGGQMSQISPAAIFQFHLGGDFYFPFKWQYALNWFTQQHHFESWKPQTEMSVQNKKALGSLRLKCSSQGQTRCLWVLRMSVLREPSKEHHSQLGIFQECSSPQKGNFSMGPSRLMSNPCINWENW